ncbi:hypothetical protein GE061_005490 [Apolygus lucorum]|uniref:Uncharacterized protein n=1 Tax=Apolygus lucorum TaxID=248454 RepID=A0A8S9WWH8_APOLU|nr:hypothetical protein GE061_005490 [Apolygus lucorum]
MTRHRPLGRREETGLAEEALADGPPVPFFAAAAPLVSPKVSLSVPYLDVLPRPPTGDHAPRAGRRMKRVAEDRREPSSLVLSQTEAQADLPAPIDSSGHGGEQEVHVESLDDTEELRFTPVMASQLLGFKSHSSIMASQLRGLNTASQIYTLCGFLTSVALQLWDLKSIPTTLNHGSSNRRLSMASQLNYSQWLLDS